MTVEPDIPAAETPGRFPRTPWSLVRRVASPRPEEARRALEEVCAKYWFPIYTFLRRSGRPPADAEDLTQSFFHVLVAENTLASASEQRGKLRSFLLGVLKRLLADQARAATRHKRGGGARPIALHEAEAEERYRRHLADPAPTPEAAYDQAWAASVLAGAEQRLRAACAEGGDLELFEHLREFLPLGDNATPYRAVAARIGVPEESVRLQVHRLRKRFGRLVEEEIRDTLEDPAGLAREREHLLQALGERARRA